jgi:uncharacterized protein (TIGR03067 family)
VGGDRRTLQLGGPDGHGVSGAWWFDTMKQRKYQLTIEYENTNPKQDDVPLWEGKATTGEVAFEIVSPEGAGGKGKQEPTKEEAVKEDLKRLQGTWRGPNSQLVIEGDKYSYKSGKRGLAGTLRLDPTRKPKWLDATFVDGDKPILLGIYEVERNTLKLSWAQADGPEGRPNDISKAVLFRRVEEPSK